MHAVLVPKGLFADCTVHYIILSLLSNITLYNFKWDCLLRCHSCSVTFLSCTLFIDVNYWQYCLKFIFFKFQWQIFPFSDNDLKLLTRINVGTRLGFFRILTDYCIRWYAGTVYWRVTCTLSVILQAEEMKATNW